MCDPGQNGDTTAGSRRRRASAGLFPPGRKLGNRI